MNAGSRSGLLRVGDARGVGPGHRTGLVGEDRLAHAGCIDAPRPAVAWDRYLSGTARVLNTTQPGDGRADSPRTDNLFATTNDRDSELRLYERARPILAIFGRKPAQMTPHDKEMQLGELIASLAIGQTKAMYIRFT